MDASAREIDGRRGPGTTTALLLAVGALAAGAAGAPAAVAQEPLPPADRTAAVVRAVEAIDGMRSSLARTFSEGGAEADRETFRAVCQPVGQRARRVAGEHGWRFEQLSRNHRAPDHAPDPEAEAVLHRMEEDTGLSGVWRRTRLEGRPGWRYFRRIVVEPACLACHGAKEERPAFVRKGYPEDRAYGFEVGDLRGAYAVFVPADSAPGSAP